MPLDNSCNDKFEKTLVLDNPDKLYALKLHFNLANGNLFLDHLV